MSAVFRKQASRRKLHVANPGSDSDGSDDSLYTRSTATGPLWWVNQPTNGPGNSQQSSLPSPVSSNSTSADNESSPTPATPHEPATYDYSFHREDHTPVQRQMNVSTSNLVPPTNPLNVPQKQRHQLPKRPQTSPTTSFSPDPIHSLHAAPSYPSPPSPNTIAYQRPPSPPSASTSSPGTDPTISDKTLILVTSDSSLYANVEITGAINAAFIREKIFSALSIYDDEEQSQFSIYQTEIGGFAMSKALSDEDLFQLCRTSGDSKGSLKLLVSHSAAHVHEHNPRPPLNIPAGNTITPPVLPPPLPPPPPPHHASSSSVPQYPYPPLQPKRRHSLSRRGSMSSRSATSERGGGGDGGYDADSEKRDTIRAPPQFNCVGAPGTSAPLPTSPLANRRPSQPQPVRPGSPPPPPPPLSFPYSTSHPDRNNRDPVVERFVNVPPPPPPPLSPNRATFDDNAITPPARSLNHIRSGSDAALERDREREREQMLSPSQSIDHFLRRPLMSSKSRPDLRKPQRGRSDEDGSRDSWVFVPKEETSASPPTPESSTKGPSRRSPATKQQTASPSRNRYASRIPPPPKVTAPTPGPSNTTSIERERDRLISPRGHGQQVPANWAVRWQPPVHNNGSRSGAGVRDGGSGGGGSGSGFMRGAKSVDNLRLGYNAPLGNSASREVPPILQPGTKRPPLSSNTHRVNGSHNLGSGSSTAMPPPSSSYTTSREPSAPRLVRPLPGPGHSHSTNSSGSSSTLSPSHDRDPFQRPSSALGDAMSPTLTRALSPTHQIPTSLRSGTGITPLPQPPLTLPPASPTSPTSTTSRIPSSGSSTFVESSTSPSEESTVSSSSSLPDWYRKFFGSPATNDSATVIAPRIKTGKTPLPPIPVTSPSTPAGTVIPLPKPSTPTSLYGTTISGMSEDWDSDGSGGGTWMKRPVLKVDTTGTPSTSSNSTSSSLSNVPAAVPTINAQPPSGSASPPSTTPTPQHQPQRRRMRGSTFTTPEAGWATRPEPEDMYERLEDFFPHHDLDKPVIDAGSGGTSPTSAVGSVPPVPNIVLDDKEKEKKIKRGKKSIRIVAEEHKKRIDRTSRMVQPGPGLDAPPCPTPISKVADVLRKRSTKLWGSKLEEVTTKTSPSHPEPSPGGAATFKWVRGEMIGRGTYGKVYLALNATTGEMMAVKQVELPRTASDRNDTRQHTVVQALKMESETLKDLDHPHIVQYLGFEETPTNLSIFLEYVPGGSIGSVLLKHGKLSEVNTQSFTGQILSGLEYLHSKGILHRDLKADNILVEMSGVCKISDFGISKRSADDGAETAMQGTVFWMAPEVVNPQGTRYSFKVDIWSVGCVVLEMLAGTRPWVGDEMFAVMFKLYQEKVPPPVPEGVKLSELADDFRRKCFAINPEERPSAPELRRHKWLELPQDWQFQGFS